MDRSAEEVSKRHTAAKVRGGAEEHEGMRCENQATINVRILRSG